MDLRDKVIVITGAASGIGAACASRFAKEGPRLVVCADLDEAGAGSVAQEINDAVGRVIAASAVCDVSHEGSVQRLIDDVIRSSGAIDVFFANAGVSFPSDPLTDDERWDRAWRVNAMTHVWAARHLLPTWLERGEGYFVVTASMAGILSAQGQAAYAVTKHAAVGFAEWMAITYRNQGVRVSCVCPGGVNTPMLTGFFADGGPEGARATGGDLLEPARVADIVTAGIQRESTLILTHPEMQVFMERKVTDHDRWIGGMARQWESS